MFSLQAQLGPIVEAGEERQESAKQALVLRRQFEGMFRQTARRAHSIGERLCIAVSAFPLQYDAASCLHVFARFFTMLEEAVQSLDSVIDKECRQLLSSATTHVFSPLSHIDPSFNLGLLLEPIPEGFQLSLVNGVRDDVNVFSVL